MKLHIITVGKPKLAYAQDGWNEYFKRLGRYHDVRVTHLADKYADDAAHILQTAGNSHKVVMEIMGQEFTSPTLAAFLETRALDGQELSFIIGGPNGLPEEVRTKANTQWSLGRLTLPHDLAMVVTLEALYRASSIVAGHPYHRA